MLLVPLLRMLASKHDTIKWWDGWVAGWLGGWLADWLAAFLGSFFIRLFICCFGTSVLYRALGFRVPCPQDVSLRTPLYIYRTL